MTVYICQGRYTREAMAGMVDKPEDRAEAVAALLRSIDAKLIDYYVTFGEYDWLLVIESGKGRNEIDTLSALLTAGATGGVTDLKTTVAVRSKDATKAMRAAKKMLKEFRPAGQPG